MSDEALWISLPPLGWALYALGGTTWKGWRRYVYPLVLGLALFWHGTAWWAAALTAGCFSAVCHLGYGDAHAWPWRVLVGLLMGLSLAPLGGPWGVWLVPSAAFLLTFWVSRRWDAWPWKLSEGLVGLTHAITAAWLVTH